MVTGAFYSGNAAGSFFIVGAVYSVNLPRAEVKWVAVADMKEKVEAAFSSPSSIDGDARDSRGWPCR